MKQQELYSTLPPLPEQRYSIIPHGSGKRVIRDGDEFTFEMSDMDKSSDQLNRNQTESDTKNNFTQHTDYSFNEDDEYSYNDRSFGNNHTNPFSYDLFQNHSHTKPLYTAHSSQEDTQGPQVTPFVEYQEKTEKSRSRKTPLQILKTIPFVTYLMTVIQVAIFIYELVEMKHLTGQVIQTQPYFNPMIGPSTYVQIYIGSRFPACMHTIPGITDDLEIQWPCPNSTTTDTEVCSLKELCHLSDGSNPNQTWRIVSAIYLHAGFIHLIFNLLLQVTMGREIEIWIGSLRYLIIYVLSGISGNVFGLNFAGDGMSSSGASGSLFGVIATNLVIFLLHKDKTTVGNYKTLVAILVAELIIMLVLGLLPGLDNFVHIGGFIAGALLSIIILNNPNFVLKKRNQVSTRRKFSWKFKSENVILQRFWIWNGVRFVCLLLLIAWFVGLGLNFSKNGGGNCKWCKYLSCLPVNGWCEVGNLTTGSTTRSKLF